MALDFNPQCLLNSTVTILPSHNLTQAVTLSLLDFQQTRSILIQHLGSCLSLFGDKRVYILERELYLAVSWFLVIG